MERDPELLFCDAGCRAREKAGCSIRSSKKVGLVSFFGLHLNVVSLDLNSFSFFVVFHQFQMDKRIPRKAPMGRYEAQRVVEEALGRNGCKEADVMLSLSVAVATVTALRPGSLGYSHPEWDGQEGRIGKVREFMFVAYLCIAAYYLSRIVFEE